MSRCLPNIIVFLLLISCTGKAYLPNKHQAQDLILAPDGSSIMLTTVDTHNRHYIMIDGRKYGPFDEIYSAGYIAENSLPYFAVQIQSNICVQVGKQKITVDDINAKYSELIIGSVSEKYILRYLSINGQILIGSYTNLSGYDSIWVIGFSKGDHLFSAIGKKSLSVFVQVNQKILGPFEGVIGFSYSDDGKHYGFIARQQGADHLYIDGVPVAREAIITAFSFLPFSSNYVFVTADLDQIYFHFPDRMLTTPLNPKVSVIHNIYLQTNGELLGYGYFESNRFFNLIDGQEWGGFDTPLIRFIPTGDSFVFTCLSNKKTYVYHNSTLWGPYLTETPTAVEFSDDGKHFGIKSFTADGQYIVSLDGVDYGPFFMLQKVVFKSQITGFAAIHTDLRYKYVHIDGRDVFTNEGPVDFAFNKQGFPVIAYLEGRKMKKAIISQAIDLD